MTAEAVDRSPEGIRKRWAAIVHKNCPQEASLQKMIPDRDNWSKIMKEVKKLPSALGQKLLSQFFAPLPHGIAVGNLMAKLLYHIPWLKPRGNRQEIVEKLQQLARQFQYRLQPFGLSERVPLRIISNNDAVRYAANIAGRGAAWEAARRAAVNWDIADAKALDVVNDTVGSAAWEKVRRAVPAALSWNVVVDADDAAEWIIGQDQPQRQGKKSPFASLLAMCELGSYPIGFVENRGDETEFVIYLPRVRAT